MRLLLLTFKNIYRGAGTRIQTIIAKKSILKYSLRHNI